MSDKALYKVTGPNGEPLHGGSGQWSLPVGTEPGDWREISGEIVACQNGLHLTDAAHLEQWIPDRQPCRIWRTEIDGELIDAGDKYVASRVRLLPTKVDIAGNVAERKAEFRIRLAEIDAAYAVAIPQPWAAYLRAVGTEKLPEGHPGRQYQRAEADAARQRTDAWAAAQRAYTDAIIAGAEE